MRLACVLFNYFPSSGLARDCLRTVRCAQQRGHTVTVFTQSWRGPVPEDLTIQIVSAGGISNHGRTKRFRRALQTRLRLEHYDLVLGFNKMPGLDVYFAADDCFVAKAVQRPPWYRLTPRYHLYARFERAVCAPQSATQILYLSANQRSDFRCFHLTPDQRLHPLPPNLDPQFSATVADADTRRRLRAAVDISDQHQMLLMVGSGFHTKGVDRAIRALAALPDPLRQSVRLLIAGEGKHETYQQLARRLHIDEQVRFLGPRDDVSELLCAADVLLHPARREAGGAVLLEALLSGLPVLTLSLCGHASHIAQAGAGIVLPEPYRQQDLDNALVQILRGDNTDWRELARAYSASTPLTGMAEHIVDKLEAFNRTTIPGHRFTDAEIYLKEPLYSQLPAKFDSILALPGEVCRRAHARRTTRFQSSQQTFFIKSHFGVGWREIIKNWSSLRRPILGAVNEWYALHRLPRLGVPVATAAGYGRQGSNPAHRRSFVITEQLNAVSLEDVLLHWRKHPSKQPRMVKFKRRLIAELARIARQLHDGGLNHQDFYLCHFWIQWPGFPHDAPPADLKVFLMDLHRVQQRRNTSLRWRRKDLAGLYFSALALRPSKTDCWRFIRHYRQQDLRTVFAKESRFWRSVMQRALRLDQDHDNIVQNTQQAATSDVH